MLVKSIDTGSDGRTHSIDLVPEASARDSKIPSSPRPVSPRVTELLSDRDDGRPVWVRAPKNGGEFYTGISRAKLYEWAAKGYIRSSSIREPGAIKGVRLFNLRSILEFIARCEANGGAI